MLENFIQPAPEGVNSPADCSSCQCMQCKQGPMSNYPDKLCPTNQCQYCIGPVSKCNKFQMIDTI